MIFSLIPRRICCCYMDCVSHCHDVVLREFNSSETMTWNLTSWRSMRERCCCCMFVYARLSISNFPFQDDDYDHYGHGMTSGFWYGHCRTFSLALISSRRRRRMLSLFVSDYVPKKGNFSQWVSIETRNDVKGSVIKENWISRWDISNFPSLILLFSCPAKIFFFFI